MSNNLVSQQLSIPNGDMGQLQPTYSNVDPSISDMQMGMMGSMSNDSAPHQFAISNQQMQLVDTMSYIPSSQNLPMSDTQLEHMDTMVDNMEPQKLLPNQNDGGMEAMFLGSQKLFPTKRKAAGEPMSNSSVPQQLSIPNKRAAHMQPPLSSPELLHHHGLHKKTVQSQSMLRSATGPQKSPTVNKKMARNESISTKSGSQRAQTPKGRTIQMETTRKGQSESSEAVRSKMRESLAGALALVCQDQNITPQQEKSPPQTESITPIQTEQLKPAEPAPVPVDAADAPENSIQFSGQDSIYNTVLPEGDVSFTDSFFVKDELLQGNGLSWAWDMDMVQPVKQLDAGNDLNEQKVRSPEDLAFKTEEKELQTAKNGDVGGDGGEQNLRSPKDLAFKIELELFKLFGGVNKKYKEKGRSLMFNLKDKNNPELRERVMSGEISPEKLCSMTAEDLASKELSEWRTAKAEELAQMIVLPESDGDRRRLVKKTHKGEYQVEVEQDDSASVEVSVGSTTFTQARPKVKEIAGPSSENEVAKDQKNVEGEKGGMENQDASYSLTIPADGTDLMQGLIEDEFKDAELLPPIVSLDEFMESLNTEPPFDNLSVDATGQTKPLPEKEKSESNNKPVASDLVDTKPGKFTKLDAKVAELEVEVKSSDSPVDKKHSSPDIASRAEHVWEGALQLHISALVTVIGLFRSGEKTSTREWPSSLEIKGRVRLDAFEKFVQELPMSRSRAVMVVQFVLKAGSSEDERASIREVVDSYVLDERLGFAEPATGVELYLCPTHPKILDLLGRHLVKDQNEIVNSTTDNGLIGVVVWRKPHIISPNSTSHHKHGSSKKQQHLTSRRHEKDTNVNSNLTSRTPVPFGQKTHTRPGPTPDDDEDDIPPGFGPGAQRDDDDLPEFNFSGNSNSSGPSRISSNPSRVGSFPVPSQSSRPVDKMRELVQKYGQTGQGTSQGWNDDDDDDDIPEWRPEDPHQQTRGFHQPMQPHMVNQSLRSLAPHLHLLGQRVVSPPPPPVAAMPHPTSMMHNATNPRWVHPQGFQASNVGQFHGVPPQGQPGNWRRDVPRSRGF